MHRGARRWYICLRAPRHCSLKRGGLFPLFFLFQTFDVLLGESDDLIEFFGVGPVGFDEGFMCFGDGFGGGQQVGFPGRAVVIRIGVAAAGDEVEKLDHAEIAQQLVRNSEAFTSSTFASQRLALSPIIESTPMKVLSMARHSVISIRTHLKLSSVLASSRSGTAYSKFARPETLTK